MNIYVVHQNVLQVCGWSSLVGA